MEKHLLLYFVFLFYLRWKCQYYQKIYFFYTNHKRQNGKFLWLNKTYVSFFLFFLFLFASFMALKIKTGSFSALIRHLFLVILLCLWLQKQKWQVSVTLFDFLELCFRFFYFVSDFKIKTASFYALIRRLFLVTLLDLWAIKFET